MELALRRGYHRRRSGLGQTDEISPSDYADLLAAGYTVDPSLVPTTGPIDATTGMPAITAPELTPAELTAEQTRASAWLAQIPGALSVAGKVALTAAQIAQGVAAGNIKASSTCPSGYLVAGSGQCVTAPASPSIFGGISNTTLAVVGILFVLFALGSRKR